MVPGPAHLHIAVPAETQVTFFDKLARMGGIVEEYIDAAEKASPSAQMRISRFAVDFLVWRDDPAAPWNLAALEINLRMGGTAHPYLALPFLTGGQLDEKTGLFHSPTGHAKYCRATDNLRSEAYRGLLPEDLIEILTISKPLQPPDGVGGALPPHRGAFGVREAGGDGDRQQPRGGGRPVPADPRDPRPRDGLRALTRPGALPEAAHTSLPRAVRALFPRGPISLRRAELEALV